MTAEETKKAIEVMQAFVDGKKIEVKNKSDEEWYPASALVWDFYSYDYRIKPEPHYRPFKNAKEVMEAIKEHGYYLIGRTGSKKIIREFDDGFIWISMNEIGNTYESVVNCYTFADGTPFGVKED